MPSDLGVCDMKMTEPHFLELQRRIRTLDAEEVRNSYRAGEFPRSERVKDLDKRYRWDLFFAVMRRDPELNAEVCDYLSNAHIDTALRQIVQPL